MAWNGAAGGGAGKNAPQPMTMAQGLQLQQCAAHPALQLFQSGVQRAPPASLPAPLQPLPPHGRKRARPDGGGAAANAPASLPAPEQQPPAVWTPDEDKTLHKIYAEVFGKKGNNGTKWGRVAEMMGRPVLDVQGRFGQLGGAAAAPPLQRPSPKNPDSTGGVCREHGQEKSRCTVRCSILPAIRPCTRADVHPVAEHVHSCRSALRKTRIWRQGFAPDEDKTLQWNDTRGAWHGRRARAVPPAAATSPAVPCRAMSWWVPRVSLSFLCRLFGGDTWQHVGQHVGKHVFFWTLLCRLHQPRGRVPPGAQEVHQRYCCRADTAAPILPRRYCHADTAARTQPADAACLGASVAGVLHWWDTLRYLAIPCDTLRCRGIPCDALGYLVRHPAEACAWLCVGGVHRPCPTPGSCPTPAFACYA